MTKEPLLITGGCSNSDQACTDYDIGVTVWPTLVAKTLSMELLNVAKIGASNDHIENAVFDAILENHEHRDIRVMVFWTGSNRVNLFDEQTLSEDKYELFHFDQKNVINKSFRNIKRLDQVCRSLNIPCHHRIGIGFASNTHLSEDLLEWLRNHEALKEFNFSYYEAFTGRWSSKNEGAHANLALETGHPNQKGQDDIAQMFIDTMNNIPLGTLEIQPDLIEDNFIYD